MSERLESRDWDWWELWISGRPQARIAEDAGVDQSTVSRALDRIRALIPEEDREDMVKRSLAMLTDLQAGALEIWRGTAAPLTAGKDGDYVLDPETGVHVRDHSGRLQALQAALKVNESVRRLLGLDAATKLDMAVSQGEVQAAEKVAQDAAARLAQEE
jgi:hypothetical protein